MFSSSSATCIGYPLQSLDRTRAPRLRLRTSVLLVRAQAQGDNFDKVQAMLQQRRKEEAMSPMGPPPPTDRDEGDGFVNVSYRDDDWIGKELQRQPSISKGGVDNTFKDEEKKRASKGIQLSIPPPNKTARPAAEREPQPDAAQSSEYSVGESTWALSTCVIAVLSLALPLVIHAEWLSRLQTVTKVMAILHITLALVGWIVASGKVGMDKSDKQVLKILVAGPIAFLGLFKQE